MKAVIHGGSTRQGVGAGAGDRDERIGNGCMIKKSTTGGKNPCIFRRGFQVGVAKIREIRGNV